MTKSAKKLSGDIKPTVAVAAKTGVKTDEAINIIEINSLYKTTKAIQEAIEKAVFAGSALQNEYQRIACSVLAHLDAHKDIRVVRHMLDTMPNSLRKDSMSAFIDKFGAVSFNDKGEVHYNKERKCDLKGAVKLAWYKAKREEIYRPFDLLAQLTRVLNKAEKRLQEGVHEDAGDNVTNEQVEALRNIVNSIETANTTADTVLEAQAA